MTTGSPSVATLDNARDINSSLIEEVSCEIETMRKKSNQANESNACHHIPVTCFETIRFLPGNQSCIDCQARNPDWATIS
eukprot:CAMPEP_0194212904 /NCGR_PEP_ID=MMETSP0156-20130528/13077_1 /TAXON_ID=33649 /ORGANISM="Thalassionema nitzschioides, Strain L26-B" /LENGTH=79 /DNA_ID=CAMNT_0038940805 /DNA_START=9 /DNA_END=245 /DNA_ORIENTATION=+